MSCDDSSTTFPPVVVWTKKNTTDWVFHPVGPPVDSAKYQKLRASIELAQSSGLLLVRPSIRAGDDGSQWGTPVAVGGITRNADGTTYGTTFPDYTTTTDGKRLVQPGVEAQNVSGTSLEMGLVTLKLDRRGV